MGINTAPLDRGLNADASVLWKSVIGEFDFGHLSDEHSELLRGLSRNARIVNMDQLDEHVPFFAFFLQFQGLTKEVEEIGTVKLQYILVDYPPEANAPSRSLLVYCNESGEVGFVEQSIPVFPSWSADIFKEI